jgi:hypothetical protein
VIAAALRRDRAQKRLDFAAQLRGGVFDFFRSHQHCLRRAACLGDAAGDLAERGDDRFGAVGGTGDIV